MPGILIVAHAPLASALRDCVVHVHGACPQGLEALDVEADATAQSFAQRAADALARVGGPDGALVLVDAAGATPCNLARGLSRTSARVAVLAGVNLPMLLRAVCYRNEPLDVLAARALEGGRRGIAAMDEGPQEEAAC